MQPATMTAPSRRAALAFVFVTVTIDILAFGVIIPVLPHLIQQMVGGSIAAASVWSGIFSTVFALTQFICTPIQGALSDRFGRRPVILLSCFGLGIDFMAMALAPTLPLLFVGRIVSGITAASFSTANAYIADVTPAEKRGAAFGMLGASFGIGFIIGPVIGSLLSHFGTRAPFWGAAGLAVLNFLYGVFVLPESLKAEDRTPKFDWRSATPLGSLMNLRRYPHVLGLAMVTFLDNTANYVLPATFVLYADYRYHWTEHHVGYVLAAVGVCSTVVQAALAGPVMKRLGERWTLLAGLVFGVVGFAIYGAATTGMGFIVGIPIMSLWGLAAPASQALMSRQVDASEQGRLQGAVASLASLAGIFAPFMFASIFASFIGTHADLNQPGVGFYVSALLVVAAIVVAWVATRPRVDNAAAKT
jgi:DHA1 family tetracycline resistance protein-like MFS transporter